MQFSTRILGPLARHNGASAPSEGQSADTTRRGLRSGRRALPIAAGAAVLVVAGGTVAYANVDKSVTLDVDGNVSHAHTFVGSVADFLADKHVKVGAHDTVSASGALHEGDEIVVRHGHLITVQINGQDKQVWTTALSADDALDTLAARDGDVRLVASRSSSGRPELPLDLTLHGPAQIVVDGRTIDVPDADANVAQVLAEQHVTLGPLDRVSVVHTDGHVQVVVNRVAVDQVTSTQPIAFGTTQSQDASLLQGKQKVTTAGVAGERTVVTQVTTIDGQVTNQVEVSNTVTKQPVTQVVAVGTKAPAAPKPAAPKPAAAPAAAPAASTPAVGGGAAASLNWAALAACESGGRVNAVSSNGLYYGLYQFSVSTWRAMGGAGLPSQASAAEQTARAQALYNRSGAGQWPVCGKNLFR